MKAIIIKWLRAVKDNIIFWTEDLWDEIVIWVEDKIISWVKRIKGKIVAWVKNTWEKINKSKKMKWLFLGLPAIISGIAFVIAIFNRGKSYDDVINKKVKKAKKINDGIVKSSRAFMRKRTKFKRKKL